MREERKQITGYEGLYKVSNFGNIKSLRFGKEKILKPGTIIGKDGGYCFVILYKNKNKKNHYIHRLVAETFIKNIENKNTVNHKNGVRSDNRVENLEWMTQGENEKHGYRVNGRIHGMLGKFGILHGGSKKVYQYTLDGKLLRIWNSLMDIQRELGYSCSCISACCLGRFNHATSYGYKRKYFFNF